MTLFIYNSTVLLLRIHYILAVVTVEALRMLISDKLSIADYIAGAC